jgi:hypothetical protein
MFLKNGGKNMFTYVSGTLNNDLLTGPWKKKVRNSSTFHK